MPTAPTYPGVYIEEVSSGVRTITGVATSITAFIGRALRGAVNEAVSIQSFADFERVFGGLWIDSAMTFAVRDFYRNGGSAAIVVRVVNGGSAATLNLPTGAQAPDDFLPLVAANAGDWGNALSATVDLDTRDPNDANLFNLTITETDGATEQFLNVSIDPADAGFLPPVLAQRSSLVRVAEDQNGNPVMPAAPPTATTTVATTASGQDGSALTSTQVDGSQADKTGIFALESADLFNLLCIPPYLDNGNVDQSVVTNAALYCETRRAMLLVDPPSEWQSVAAVTNRTTGLSSIGTRSKNAALFFPRIRQFNPLRGNQIDTFAPCGAVAGVMARTDAQRGVWKAPAGIDATLNGVSDLTVKLTDDNNGTINPLGVNCLRSFPVIGRVVWGARTLEGADRLASEWKYIPVRRLALFIEESLYRGTQFAVFEPNDEPLWAQIRLNIGSFMQNLFRQGAFQGQTPREAYFVKCDPETTTQNDINSGIVNISVGFAPLRPAEFVIIKLQQLAGQSGA